MPLYGLFLYTPLLPLRIASTTWLLRLITYQLIYMHAATYLLVRIICCHYVYEEKVLDSKTFPFVKMLPIS